MRIEFDSAKDAVHRQKHGLSLAFGARIFDDPKLLVMPTIRDADGAERYKAVGLVEGKLCTAVHVWREAAVRFLSVTRSNRSKEEAYHRD